MRFCTSALVIALFLNIDHVNGIRIDLKAYEFLRKGHQRQHDHQLRIENMQSDQKVEINTSQTAVLFASLESDYKQAQQLLEDAEDSDASDDEIASDKDAAKEKVIALKKTLSKLKDNVIKEAAAAKEAAKRSKDSAD